MGVKMYPLKNVETINTIITYLKGEDSTGRDALLFIFGINTALRISDTLKLRYIDIFHDTAFRFREHLLLKPNKTAKSKKKDKFIRIKLNQTLKDEIKSYVIRNKIKDKDWLFPSHKHPVNSLDRATAWKIFKRVETRFSLENFGSHSLRKTFAYQYYNKTHKIATLMKLLGHSSQEQTLKYIGIEQEDTDEAYAVIEDIYKQKEK